jgi:hypothetical protein
VTAAWLLPVPAVAITASGLDWSGEFTCKEEVFKSAENQTE